MLHPAYKPPLPVICTKAKVAKGEAYLWDTTVQVGKRMNSSTLYGHVPLRKLYG